eukprot:10801108-Alexandrium_andersonii.AAC.1
MSASLVGSEMCIRDSARSAWAMRDLAPLRQSSDARMPHGPIAGVARFPCLLYTSDAADDM